MQEVYPVLGPSLVKEDQAAASDPVVIYLTPGVRGQHESPAPHRRQIDSASQLLATLSQIPLDNHVSTLLLNLPGYKNQKRNFPVQVRV